MNLSTHLKDYAVFNYWANEQIITWLRAHPAALMEQEVTSSFPSLRLTLLHIWSAQDVWLNRLEGISQTSFISNGSLEDVFDGLLECSARFRDFVSAQEPRFFEQKTSYVHSTGPYTQYNSEILLHCLQHSTFHRGQIITMARNLGITDVPHTDYILYVRHRDAGT